MGKKDDKDKPKQCPACNGQGGEWKQPDDVSGDGKRKPGRQMWVVCKQCGGSGRA